MVFSATFNIISIISWRSVLLMEETECPEKTTDLSQVTYKLYSIMLHRVQELHTIPDNLNSPPILQTVYTEVLLNGVPMTIIDI